MLYNGSTTCKCDARGDTAEHLLHCTLLLQTCSKSNLSSYNNITEEMELFWKDYLWRRYVIVIIMHVIVHYLLSIYVIIVMYC